MNFGKIGPIVNTKIDKSVELITFLARAFSDNKSPAEFYASQYYIHIARNAIHNMFMIGVLVLLKYFTQPHFAVLIIFAICAIAAINIVGTKYHLSETYLNDIHERYRFVSSIISDKKFLFKFRLHYIITHVSVIPLICMVSIPIAVLFWDYGLLMLIVLIGCRCAIAIETADVYSFLDKAIKKEYFTLYCDITSNLEELPKIDRNKVIVVLDKIKYHLSDIPVHINQYDMHYAISTLITPVIRKIYETPQIPDEIDG